MKIRFFSFVFLSFFLVLPFAAFAQSSSATKPEIVVQTGHTFPVAHIAFSKDGKLLASSAFTETSVKLWELESGRQLRTFLLEGGGGLFGIGGVSEIAFSGNADLLAAASPKEVDVWNVKDGERLYRFPLAPTGIESVVANLPLALSANGRYLAWIAEDKLAVRDLSNRGQAVTMPAASEGGPGAQFLSLAFSPDERNLALLAYTTSGTAVNTVDLTTGAARTQKLSSHSELLIGRGLAYSNEGHLIVATRETANRGGRNRGAGSSQGRLEVRDLAANNTFAFEAPSDIVALSQDGSFVSVQDQNELQVWDVRTQQKTLSASNKGGIFNTGRTAIDFSGDGKKAAVGDDTGGIHILDPQTGKELAALVGHSNFAGAVAFDESGSRLYSGSKTAWDLKSGIGLRTIPGKISPRSVAAGNGSLFAEDAGHGVVRIWDLALQKVVATLNAEPDQLLSAIAFSPEGSLVALVRQEDYASPAVRQRQQEESQQRVKDLQKAIKRDPSQIASLNSQFAFSPDNPASQIKVYEARTGAEKFTLKGHTGMISALAFSGDTSRLASGAPDGVKFWSTADGKLLSSIPVAAPSAGSPFGGAAMPGTTSVTSLAFSPDGNSVGAALYSVSFSMDFSAMQQQMMIAAQQSGSTGSHRRIGGFGLPGIGRRSPPPPSTGMPAVNPAESMQIQTEGPVLVLDPAAGRPVATLKGHNDGAISVAFSHDGKLLATSGRDGFLRIWERASGSLDKELTTKSVAYGLAFSQDDKLLASTQSDGATLLWDIDSGQMLATLVSLYDGADWLVVTPEGLFDGSPAAWNQILWRYSRNTFDVAPVEWFFNEYFYPGLLADLVSGKRPKPPQTIANRDRKQPLVKIHFDGEGSPIREREVTLNVDVSEAPASAGQTGGSGAKEVRLFRNGSLVKVWHGDVLNGKPSVTLDAKVKIVAGDNQFTAYAFNHDNVKSRDAQLKLQGADALRRQPVTYVLAVGINQYANANYNLKLAVADAQSLAEAIQREQARTGGQVQGMPLYNEAATRSGILSAIAKVAGQAQPEDHVVLFFASHGTTAQDRFYLIPHDLGFTGNPTQLDEAAVREILEHSISDRDLEQALESMDAAKIIVIMDACNSGQALESEEKRRGPMNSRGLAQLAYEKGMYILTASQSYQAALEVSQLGHGLLTYALISEGLEKDMADDEPHDGKIMDREWLDYATNRVPEMQLETLRSFKSQGRSISFAGQSSEHEHESATSQRPKVFYRRELGLSPWVVAQASDTAQKSSR